jgi:hypothetical protein
MRRSRSVLVVVVLGLVGALVVPSGASAAARGRCRPTAFVTNSMDGTVSTIDVKTRTKNPTDITDGPWPVDVALTPDGKTALVTN